MFKILKLYPFFEVLQKCINVFSGQILSNQLPLLETLEEELTKLEDSIHQPCTYFKVIFINISIIVSFNQYVESNM